MVVVNMATQTIQLCRNSIEQYVRIHGRLLTLYPLAHKTSCKICVFCFGGSWVSDRKSFVVLHFHESQSKPVLQ